MFRKVTDIVLYKEPKINISNFLKGPKVVFLLYVINNTVLSIVSSGKQNGNSLRRRISEFSVLRFLQAVSKFHILTKPYCFYFFFPVRTFTVIFSDDCLFLGLLL